MEVYSGTESITDCGYGHAFPIKNRREDDFTGLTLTDLTHLFAAKRNHNASDICAGNETDHDKSISESEIDGLTKVSDVAVIVVITSTNRPESPCFSVIGLTSEVRDGSDTVW